MISSYVKVAVRSMARHKTLSAINILGLSVGIACFTLFMLNALNEFSFDRQHANADRIYRVYRWTEARRGEAAEGDPYLPMPLGPALKQDLADVEEYVRFQDSWVEDFVRAKGPVTRMGVTYADPRMFDVFSFPLKYGDPGTALADLRSVVLTERAASRLFGPANPVGERLEIKLGDVFEPFTVAAVAEDPPENSSIRFDVLANFEFLAGSARSQRSRDNWYHSAFQTFVLLRPGSRLADDADRLLRFRHKYYPGEEDDLRKAREAGLWTAAGAPVAYRLQPLRAMHTDPRMRGGVVPSVDPRSIWAMLAIAGSVLLIACINFTTLAIGRSAGRAREVVIRRVVGGQRKQLVFQFLSEAMIMSLTAGAIGLGLAQLLLPYFNALAGKHLSLSLGLYPEIGPLFPGLVVFAGLLAGGYPALALSSLRPVEIMRKKIHLGGSNLFTRSLVTLQFALSVALIISTLVILGQLRFMRSTSPGFDKENVVSVHAEGTPADRLFPLFRQSVLGKPEIVDATASDIGLGQGTGWSRNGWDYEGRHKDTFEYSVQDNYLAVMGMELRAGRDFDPEIRADASTSVLVNEAFVRDMGWTNEQAVGQRLTGYTEKSENTPVIIGVVKDFHFRPFGEEVKPQLFNRFPGSPMRRFFVRIRPGDPRPALGVLREAWRQLVPDLPFAFSFLDDDLDAFYRSETRQAAVVGWAGGISIFLGCLGLFGLAALAAVNRTKEIGIRKVLGATSARIATLLSKEFIRLVVVANLIAWPVAWVAMNGWLRNFAYRIGLRAWVFALAGGLSLLVALVTVGTQAMRSAAANPVETLRSE
jgi:putative ABC transport system permease protein